MILGIWGSCFFSLVCYFRFMVEKGRPGNWALRGLSGGGHECWRAVSLVFLECFIFTSLLGWAACGFELSVMG